MRDNRPPFDGAILNNEIPAALLQILKNKTYHLPSSRRSMMASLSSFSMS